MAREDLALFLESLKSAGSIASSIGKEQEEKRKYEQNIAVINNPKATPVQKALAWSDINPSVAKQELMQAQQNELVSKIFPEENAPQNIGTRAGVGAINPLKNPSGKQIIPGITAGAPPGTTQLNTPVENLQPNAAMGNEQPSQQEGQGWDRFPTSKLKEFIAKSPANSALSKSAHEELEDRRTDKKLVKQEENINRQERLQIHKDLAKADKEVHDDAKTARRRISSFNVMRKNLASGKLNPRSFENVLTTTLKGTRWENFMKNKDRAEFEAAALSSFEGMKDLFGTRLSDADLRQAAGKIPDPTKSIEANQAIIDFMEFQDQMKIAEEKIGAEIKRENGGFRPIDYQEQIQDRMQQLYGEQADKITKRAAYDGSDRPKFDPSNQEHNARRMQVLEQVGGDKVKANQILAQEFMR